MARASFVRASADERRSNLIAAAIETIAETGFDGAKVRAIALRAGVTPGLIRYHFSSKDDLLTAAFEQHMASVIDVSLAEGAVGATAAERLSRFIAASLRPPAVGARAVSLWAAFMAQVRVSPALHAVHVRAYRAFRDRLEALIAAARREAGLPVEPTALRGLAIAANAAIDGLWLEGSALPELFEDDDLVRLGHEAVGAICGLALAEAARCDTPTPRTASPVSAAPSGPCIAAPAPSPPRAAT
jgi:TetR/AcrR family transcriptional repressor of bet genes